MLARNILRAAPGLPLVFVALGIPLVLKLVPPNGLYGVRTGETLASDQVWYAANFSAGAAAVLFGLAATAVNVAVLRSASTTSGLKLHIPFVTTVMVAIAMTIAGLAAS